MTACDSHGGYCKSNVASFMMLLCVTACMEYGVWAAQLGHACLGMVEGLPGEL